MPCGGSGQLISNLGGSPKNVSCPWCAGTGKRQPNVDAQAAWRERREAESADGGTAAEGASSGDPAAPSESPSEGSGAQAAPGSPTAQ
ncbi:MAG TPA: hypothetical protein VMB91_11075 [Solirubrobacteraceae bacterium]|nr:hypothetical protein [Solirubrobacteraceae bacterium]